MDLAAFFSFDSIAIAFLACYALRQGAIFALPDRIAGPGGWLINTGARRA